MITLSDTKIYFLSNSKKNSQVVAPRFARLDESWAKDFYWHILMKYPSFLMILEVISSIY